MMALEAVEASSNITMSTDDSPDRDLTADDLVELVDDDIVLAEIDQGDDADAFEEASPSRTETPDNGTTKQPAVVMSKFLKGKEKEWEAVSHREGPLTLLGLPVDILHLIVKEITHTNDLTSLALTSSTLYEIAIPYIYARFDIVWPDTLTSTSDGKSVDALTYGLSTLCLGSTFARTTYRHRRQAQLSQSTDSGLRAPKFGGADYAKFTRKFSLGNGPTDWVAEYMITKESGKMLGTLVAMAVSKMVNLEAFVWDMPTGVVSDIFMALASLPDHNPQNECKLERLWIRWHDNNEPAASSSSSTSPVTPAPQLAVVPLGSTLTPIGILLPSTAAHPKPRASIPYSESNVEYPTFSVVPPIKCLTVLDIDEVAYLDEIAILIERSKGILRELRVGISAKAQHRDFVQTWDGADLQQVDHTARWPGESTIGDRRLGGVLGVLFGRIYDIRRRVGSKAKDKASSSNTQPPPQPQTETQLAPNGADSQTIPLSQNSNDENSQPQAEQQSSATDNQASTSENQTTTTPAPIPPSSPRTFVEASTLRGSRSTSEAVRDLAEPCGRKRLEGKLKLHTLELERIPLSIQVCSKAIDWTALTNLTILECNQHETLWKMLKRQFQPTPISAGFGISALSRAGKTSLEYHLNLKHIHTDYTSPSLIIFIKETLQPNTLEVLFLQDRRRGSMPPPVTIDTIFKGALKRHRSSLRKLLLDSSTRNKKTGGPSSDNTRWRHWALNTDILIYMTSGRMTKLRELAVSLHHRDWHTFLQRLPNIPHLRSLDIPYITEHIAVPYEPKELAMQITDIIALRPEISLSYVGISSKCFEILEAHGSDNSSANGGSTDGHGGGNHSEDGSVVEVINVGADGEETTDDDDDGSDTDEDVTPTNDTDPDETQSEHSDDFSDDDSFVEPDQTPKTRLRLREILFYDDKVAIFKARHGKL